MLKRFRFLVSANLVAFLFVSTLILSKPVSVRACEDSPPATLLALYFGSDLIVLADIKDERDGKIISDEGEYLYLEVERTLRVSSVLKGKRISDPVFSQSEYRSKAGQAEEPVEEQEGEYISPYGYKNFSKLTVGERYLFFLRKNPETERYELTDEFSGAKRLSDYDLGVYKKRIKELKSIAGKKENQLSELTEWIMRCIDDPATRWDAVISLNNSFDSLQYSEEDSEPEEQDENSFVIGNDFSDYTPKIAESLTDKQKDHISGILFGSLQQNLFEKNAESFNYLFAHLVKRWDKMRLATYAFGILQTLDKSDVEKTTTLMNYISGILEDGKLYEISSEYPVDDSSEIVSEQVEIAHQNPADGLSEKTEEIIEQKIEMTGESENKVEENSEPVQKPEQNTDSQVKNAKETVRETEKLTLAQQREKTLQKFINRFEYLLVRGFPVENETEAGESN